MSDQTRFSVKWSIQNVVSSDRHVGVIVSATIIPAFVCNTTLSSSCAG